MGTQKDRDTYCVEIYRILSKYLLNDSKNLFYKNRFKFPELSGPEIFENEMLLEVFLVAEKNPICLDLFEREADYNHFQRYIYGIYRYVRLGFIKKWILKSKNLPQTITFDFLGEAFEHLFVYRDSYENEEEINKKEFLFERMKASIQKMRNRNRKKVMELWLQNSKIRAISQRLNMNENTVSAHIHRGKREIRRDLEA
jgi:DNA-directed RNA polymerase specialized sigma24 family protein